MCAIVEQSLEAYSTEMAKDPRFDGLQLRIKTLENQPRSGLTSEDRTWITKEIGTVLQSLTASSNNGWMRFIRWLRDWGATGAAITGAIAIFGIMLTAVYFAVSESSRNSEFSRLNQQ